MAPYLLLLTSLGGLILLTAWLPDALKGKPLSLPMVCIAVGALVSWLGLLPAAPNPLENRELTLRLTELVVILSLMGAGLKLDRPVGLRAWAVTWRLLGVAMPLTIAAIAALGWGVLGLDLPSAILLGAVLAPTDPVLASDVQVGPPNTEEEDEVRFALTSEAGLNDALAFPFVHLAIALALASSASEPWLMHWVLEDVLWKTAAGLGIGWLLGRVLGHVTFRVESLAASRDGLVAVGITLLAYGLTELAHGYGFLAVFVAAATLRSVERRHPVHEHLHAFTEQIERLLMMAVLVCFGAAVAEGSVVAEVGWTELAFGALVLLVVRPVAGMIGLLGRREPFAEQAVIAFFGIRGLGSMFYLAYAMGEAEFAGAGVLWGVICVIVIASILLHGVAVAPAMSYLDRRRR